MQRLEEENVEHNAAIVNMIAQQRELGEIMILIREHQLNHQPERANAQNEAGVGGDAARANGLGGGGVNGVGGHGAGGRPAGGDGVNGVGGHGAEGRPAGGGGVDGVGGNGAGGAGVAVRGAVDGVVLQQELGRCYGGDNFHAIAPVLFFYFLALSVLHIYIIYTIYNRSSHPFQSSSKLPKSTL